MQEIQAPSQTALLDPDKNAFFKSKISKDLVRTGTVSDGSCYFHSILKAINKKYSNASTDTKESIIEKLRSDIAKDLKIDIYKLTNVSKINFDMMIFELLPQFYEKNELINKNLTYEQLDKMITKIITTCQIDDLSIKLVKSPCFIDIVDDIEDIVDRFCKDALEKSFKKFKRELADTETYANDTMFFLVSQYFDIDIYFLKIDDGEPYIMPGLARGDRNSIIIGIIGEHFENIGVICRSSGKNKGVIKRLFNPSDEIIQKIRNS